MPKEFKGFIIFYPSNSVESKEGENASPENNVITCWYLLFYLWKSESKYAAPAFGYFCSGCML